MTHPTEAKPPPLPEMWVQRQRAHPPLARALRPSSIPARAWIPVRELLSFIWAPGPTTGAVGLPKHPKPRGARCSGEEAGEELLPAGVPQCPGAQGSEQRGSGLHRGSPRNLKTSSRRRWGKTR